MGLAPYAGSNLCRSRNTRAPPLVMQTRFHPTSTDYLVSLATMDMRLVRPLLVDFVQE